MKNTLLMLTVILCSVFASAQSMFDNMTPEQLSDYEITVSRKSDGKVLGKMSRAEYKVVKLNSSVETDNKELLKIVHVLHDKVTESSTLVNNYNNGYFTVIGHVGQGKDGLDHSTNGAFHTVSENDTIIGGATGCYSRGQNGVCISGFTNSSVLLGVKRDLFSK